MIVEVFEGRSSARPGEVGEVVATRLHAFAMPFIRYRLGDLVTQGDAPCACGAPFSTIFTVQGRMLDYFPLANGRLFHPYELVMIILEHGGGWIGQYQLTQERRAHSGTAGSRGPSRGAAHDSISRESRLVRTRRPRATRTRQSNSRWSSCVTSHSSGTGSSASPDLSLNPPTTASTGSGCAPRTSRHSSEARRGRERMTTDVSP